MKRQIGLGLALCVTVAMPALAQVERLPPDLQQKLSEFNTRWMQEHRAHPDGRARGGTPEESAKAAFDDATEVFAMFQPVLGSAPKQGVVVKKDISYGPDARHLLDVYRNDGLRNAPVIVFIHGGGGVAGDRDAYGEAYGNVATWFARRGLLGINATYRLAPQTKWPGAAQDIGTLVSWLKRHAGEYGGDPGRIYLIGHSAGASNVAAYLFDGRTRDTGDAGVAGAVLISGRYLIRLDPRDPSWAKLTTESYYGEDARIWPDRSSINRINEPDAARVPLLLVSSEFDNIGTTAQTARLFSALCDRDYACPGVLILKGHNHLSEMAAFNTPDEELGLAILDYFKLR